MYHLTLNNFPHSVNRYNMDEGQLMAILVPFTRGQEISLGEQTWDPKITTVIVYEAPEVPLGQLSLGRGWGGVERSGRDVTTDLLERAATPAAAGLNPAGGEFADLLGADGARLLDQWRSVTQRSPDLAPSEALALAEHALRTRGGV